MIVPESVVTIFLEYCADCRRLPEIEAVRSRAHDNRRLPDRRGIEEHNLCLNRAKAASGGTF
jgi:hypothetical protein